MLADDLIEVHSNPRQIQRFSDRYPGLTPDEGYAAAAALRQHRLDAGWRSVGRKIGFTNRSNWARYGGYEPIWGTVYDRTLIMACDDRAEVSLTGLVQPRIEPEICFKLKHAPRDWTDLERLLESIEWIAHSVEIVQCHHPDWKFRLADCTADNGLHGRLVVGSSMRIADVPRIVENLPRLSVLLKKQGKVIDRGSGESVLGSPLLALAHLADALAGQPKAPPLTSGEIVTTGTLTDAHPVQAGELWSTELAGIPLPGLTVLFR